MSAFNKRLGQICYVINGTRHVALITDEMEIYDEVHDKQTFEDVIAWIIYLQDLLKPHDVITMTAHEFFSKYRPRS